MLLYRYVPVWSRVEGKLVLYRCFEVIGQGFTVQSRDNLYANGTSEDRVRLESQFLELLFEEAPEVRSPIFPSISETINAFDADFGS